MCGIAGIFDPRARLGDLTAIIGDMADTLHLRGPDGRGTFVSDKHDVALGHRRLSVIDLAESGQQPMVSVSGRMVLVFNGEIYNFKELRSELESAGCSFRTETDTEVLLEGCEYWGVRQTVDRLVGMFAFGLYDRENSTLSLVRDRVGIKPLLLWNDGSAVVFGSELRALESCPLVPSEIDPVAISSLLRFSCIVGSTSILRGVEKVPPGTIVSLANVGARIERSDFRYWDPVKVALELRGKYDSCSFEEQVDLVEQTLSRAVHDRLVSDVPLGSFLSGGIDSSLVVAFAQSHSPRPLKTFTIGMAGSHLDESKYAARIADHLGTDHTEHVVTPDIVMDLIPKMATVYDEPFADSSQIPTYLVSQVARRDVTVALSGDGGDELFGGYVRYTLGLATWRRLRRLPAVVRRLCSLLIRTVPDGLLDASGGLFGPQEFSHRCQRLCQIMSCTNLEEMNSTLLTTWQGFASIAPAEAVVGFDHRIGDSPFSDEEAMMMRDFKGYLVDDILTKVDRASMAVSLEARVPLLDHRVAELAWGLPLSSKISGGRGKHILSQVLARHVPRELFERPKMGFSIPVVDWLRGPLADWAVETLRHDSLRDVGLEPAAIEQLWRSFVNGESAAKNGVWALLMLSGWLQARQG